MSLPVNTLIRTNRAMIAAFSASAYSLGFALLLSNRALTPIIFTGDDSVIPWAKWLVALVQLVLLVLFSLSRTYGIACLLAIGFGILNLAALSLNGVSALIFWGWNSESQGEGLLILFLIAQAVMVVAAYRVLIKMT